MSTLDELQSDQHFISATPADQIKYLSDTDPSFKAAHPDDQAAFLAHVTKQPTGAEPYAPAKTAGEALGVAGDFWNKQGAVAPGDKGADAPGSARYIAQQVAKNLVGEPRSGSSVEEQAATAMMQPYKKTAEVAGRLATGALGMATQFYHAFADKPKDEEEQAVENTGIPGVGESLLTGRLGGRLALAGKRLAIDPSMSAYGQTLGQEATDKAAGQEHGAMEKAASRVGNIPVIGPFLTSEGERAGTGDILGAAGDIAAMEASGKVAKEVPKEFPTVNAAIRTGAEGYEAVHRNLPAVGAAVGGIAGTVEHGPAGAAIGTLAGERGGRVLQKITPDATKLTTHGLTQAEKDIKFHEAATKVADKAKAKADEDVAHYAASESAGPLNETDNPAYKKAKDAQAKAATAQAEAHFHLQEAREAARVAAPDKEITPAEVAAARPESPTPTKEENDAKLAKLMEQAAPTEKPAPTPENVKIPGQVQPETFPQTPTEAPRVDETTAMRPLAGGKGTIVGHPPRMLTEGTPEAAPETEVPKGEILPPEKPATATEMRSLKPVEGKVVDTQDQLQRKLEEGLQGKAKPVAMKSLGAREQEALGKITPQEAKPEFNDKGQRLGVPTETPQDLGKAAREAAPEPKGRERRATVRTAEDNQNTELFRQARQALGEDATSDEVAAKMEELKAAPKKEALTAPNEKELKNEGLSPEDVTKVQDVISQHTDQDLLRLAKKNGIDTDKYDLSKRDEKRHRVERDQMVKDILAKLPDVDKTNIARLSDEFGKKDSNIWTEAERSSLSKAQRTRAIMQEHEGGAKAVAGGAPDEHEAAVKAGGGEYKGVQEGVPEAGLKGLVLFDHPETHSTLALPEDKVTPEAVKAKLEEHKTAWDKAKDEAIAKEHNAEGGSSLLKNGKVESGYVVGINKELEKVLNKAHIDADDVKEYREQPAVQKALKENPDAFIGTWVDGRKTYLDTSIHEPNLEAAKKLAKDNNQRAIFDANSKTSIPLEESAKQYKDMTPEEKEEFAKNTPVSGGAPAKKLPTGDELIKKYGESDGDPAHTAFLLKDGRMVHLPPGNIHDQMLGGKPTDDLRTQFANEQGGIRLRPHGTFGGRQFNVSLPEAGISEKQLSQLVRWEPQMRTGTQYLEVAKPEGKTLTLQQGTGQSLEKAIKQLVPILKDETGLPDLAEQNLLPEEKEGVSKSKQQLDRFVVRMTEMPEIQEWVDAASKGAGERKWYQRSASAFDAMSKEAPNYFDQEGDRDKFVGLLASGSPQQSVVNNMREALRVWTNYVDNGRPTGEKLEKLLSKPMVDGGFTLPGAKIPNAMKALAGEPLWPDITKNSNFKVPSFRDNLTGMLNRVTNDGWMALFSGLDARDISSAHSYHPISVMVRVAAKELGWEPAEAQAAIWAFIKTLTEKGVEASEDPTQMRQYSEDFADIIQHDPETRALLKDMGVSHAELDKRLAAIQAKPEAVPSGGSPTAEDSARRAYERVENARGKGTIPAAKTGLLDFGEPEAERGGSDEATSFNTQELEAGENKPVDHTYEYKDSGTLKHVDAKDKDGNVVATVLASPEENDPNTWTVGFSKSTTDTKGVGLGAYDKLAKEAKAEAERTGKPIILQGDKQMSAAAVRTWVKLGEDKGYDVQWSKDNRPHITFRSSNMKPLRKSPLKRIE
jgi:hypothetical protein